MCANCETVTLSNEQMDDLAMKIIANLEEKQRKTDDDHQQGIEI